MAKPQQPELARSGRGAVDPHAVKEQLSAPTKGGDQSAEPGGSPVPEENQPGHHPEHDQDKPSGDAFVAKVREHAADAEADAGEGDTTGTIAGEATAEAEPAVRERSDDGDANGTDHGSPVEDVREAAGTVAGDALRAAAGVVRKVRARLPGD